MYYQIFLKCVLSISFALLTLSVITPPVNCCWGSPSTNLGEITPDQKLLNGSQLLIDCSLHENTIQFEGKTYHVDSSMIFFKFDKKIYPKNRIQIINETVARLVVDKASEDDNGLYFCILNITDAITKPFICLTQVTVGYKPQYVKDFRCISLYYHKLHCSWTPPKNPIPTTYHLEDKFHDRLHPNYDHLTRQCGNVPSENSCEWTMDSEPPYRNTAQKFNLLLTGTNEFGNSTQMFVIDHYSIIKPNVPKNLRASEVSTTTIALNWNPPEFIEFDDDLLETIIYEIRYFSHYSTKEMSRTIILDGIKQTSLNLTDLVPYLNYNISIRCKTEQSVEALYWSEFSSIIVRTNSDVPYLAPEIIPESFQTDKNMEGMRSITLFWKEISPEYRNGPEFYYSVRYKSIEKRKSRAINLLEKPEETDIRCHNTSYTFIHMKSDAAYEFTILGANSIGESSKSSRILVQKNDMIPHKPSNIDVYSFGGGRYEIHWAKPRINSMSGPILNYTVFWCQNLRPRPFPCEGPIDWYSTVNTSVALELPDIGTNYQFAVSANALDTSSGMSWAECIVPIDGRLDKLSEVRLKVHNSTSIVVNWKLNCPAQKRVVEGYKIKFCRIDSGIDDSVKTNCEKTESVEVDNTVENYTLSDLNPFTRYRVTVLAYSDSGPSEESDPRFETTFHDSPEDAPSGLRVTQKSEDSITLMWRYPVKPNGHISHFNVEIEGKIFTQSSSNCNESVCYYTIERLEPYHSYQIRVRACNNEALCSPLSHLLKAMTSSSVPMPMDPPRSEVINSTTVRISWSPPVESNGPIDYFFIKLIRFDNSTEIFNISGKTREYFLKFDCDSTDDTSSSYRSQYSVQISSSNILETGVSPLAEYSESTNLNACLLMRAPDMAYIIGLITGGALGLVVLVLVLVTLVRWMKNKINSYRHLQIELPKGLEIPVLVTDSGPNDGQPFDPFNRSDSYINVGIIDDNDSIIDKNRHGSGLSHTSNSSTELLYNKTSNKGKDNFFRMVSDESGQPGSVSSTEAHMSSDSGVENDNQLQNKELIDILILNKNNPKSVVDDNSRNSDSSDSKDSGILDTNSGKIRNPKKKRNPKMATKINPKISSIVQSNAVTNPLYDTPMSHSVCIYSLLANSEPSLFEVGVRENHNILNDLTKYSKPFLAKSLTDIIQCYSPSDPKVNCIICETNATSSRNSSRTSTPICPYYKYGIKRQNHNQNNHLVNVSPVKKEDVKATKPYVQLDSILQNGQSVPPKSSKKKLEHDWSQNSYDAEVSSTSSNGDNEQTDGIFNQNNCLSKSSQSFTECQKIQNKIQNNPSIEDNTELIDIDSPVNPLNTSSNDLVIEFDPQLDAIKDLNQTNDRKPVVMVSPTHLVKDSNGYVLHNTLNHLSANQTKPNLIKNSNGYVVIDAMGSGFDGIEMTDYVPNASVVNNVTQV